MALRWLAGLSIVAVLAGACAASAPTMKPLPAGCSVDPNYTDPPVGATDWRPPSWWSAFCPANAAFQEGWTASPFVPVQEPPGPDGSLLVGGGAIVGGSLVALGVYIGRRRPRGGE